MDGKHGIEPAHPLSGILRRRRWTWAQKLCHKPPQRRGAHGVCGVPSDKVFQIFTKGNEFRISYHHLILYDTLFPYNFPVYPQSTVRPCRFQLAFRSPPSWPPRRRGRERTAVQRNWGLDQRKSD